MNERELAGDSAVPEYASERAARVGSPEGVETAVLVSDPKAAEAAQYLRERGVPVGIATDEVVGGIRGDGVCPLTADESQITVHPLALVLENPVRCPTCEKWVERHQLVNGDCPIAINQSISGELKDELRAKHNPAHDAIAPLELPKADLKTDEGRAQLAAGDEPLSGQEPERTEPAPFVEWEPPVMNEQPYDPTVSVQHDG